VPDFGRASAAARTPPWFARVEHRSDLVARAMRLIGDGTVDREGVAAWPPASATPHDSLNDSCKRRPVPAPCTGRAQRTQTARLLIETTDLPFSDIAFAAGFSSIRQFNDTLRMVCDSTPTELRKRATARSGRAARDVRSPGTVSLRLPVRVPFAYEGVFGHLAAGVVPGCEEIRDGGYRRTLRLPSATASQA